MKSDGDERDEFSAVFENCQGIGIADRDGKIIPPARDSEQKCSESDFVTSPLFIYFIYIAPLTIQIVTKHCTISK